jgi:cytochrome c oxidase assembly factor CtaG
VTTTQLLLSAWEPGLAVPATCVVALGAYTIHARGRLSGRAALFVLAVALFFLALASPIGVLSRGYLFSAHMLQHLLLVLAVPPLALLGLPREDEASLPRERFGPVGAWVSGIGAMWIWHAKPLCNAAAVSSSVQAVQTVSLVVMGLMFWRPIVAPQRSRRLEPLAAALYLFSACIACTILGVVVTLSPVEVCSAYMHPADPLDVLPLLREGWGMTCKADQEIGGLLMWVPACFVYASAILATLGRYYALEGSGVHAVGGAE